MANYSVSPALALLIIITQTVPNVLFLIMQFKSQLSGSRIRKFTTPTKHDPKPAPSNPILTTHLHLSLIHDVVAFRFSRNFFTKFSYAFHFTPIRSMYQAHPDLADLLH